MKEATNSTLMRQRNEKIILSLIRTKPISRAEIAKETGLTKAAVSIIVDDLIKRQIVSEQHIKLNCVGRNPVMLSLKAESVCFAGINITRKGITVGLTDLSGRVLTEDRMSLLPPEEAFIAIGDTLKGQLERMHLTPERIHKVGVVTPGPVDVKEGKILNPPNFASWHRVGVVEELEKCLDFEVVFANVSSATAIAEKYFGAAKAAENFLALQIDEGIGSGIVTEDRLFDGPCELGHISIQYDGTKCECGNVGCLEKYAAIPQILKGTGFTCWQEAVDSTDTDVVEREAEYLSAGIIAANNLFRLDEVVLCGALAYKAERIIDCIGRKLAGNMLVKQDFRITSGQIGSKALIGAAMAIRDFFVG